MRRHMRSLLVTGGAGFIGANFVIYWTRKYPDDHVVVIDALTYAGNRANLACVEDHPHFQFVHGDIGDKELVQSLLVDGKLDTIVHFAAESHNSQKQSVCSGSRALICPSPRSPQLFAANSRYPNATSRLREARISCID